MADPAVAFYDDLAEHHHLIFADWSEAIVRQAAVLDRLIGAGPRRRSVLDCACGIGTQALGLAERGHRLTGSDLSPGAIARADQPIVRARKP